MQRCSITALGGALALASTGPAAAAVYPGCTAPPTAYTAAYEATPATLAGLLKSAKPGSVIRLASGAYGSVRIQGWTGVAGSALVAYDNPIPVTVTAAPGATPVLRQLQVLGAAGWVFDGLTIESLNTSGAYATGGGAAPDSWLVTLKGPHTNIVLRNLTLRSQADTSAWGIADWIAKRSSGIQDVGGSCVAIVSNHLSNVGFGVQTQRSTNVLIQANAIDRFADDGIDYGSDNLLIADNTITNSIEDGDGFHRDGMQGQPYNEATVVSNVTITGNTVIRIADPGLKFPGYLQGIDTFDGVWRALTIEHNQVVTDAWAGIAYYGVTGLRIVDNVLAQDGGRVLPCYGLQLAACETKSVGTDTSTVPAIDVTKSKAGAPSANVDIAGNVASGFTVDLSTRSVTLTGDICVGTLPHCVVGVPVAGKMVWTAAPGSYAGVTISPLTAPEYFTTFDTARGAYVLTPKAPR